MKIDYISKIDASLTSARQAVIEEVEERISELSNFFRVKSVSFCETVNNSFWTVTAYILYE